MPIRNGLKLNGRMVKRLKNKLWRIYKRKLGIVGRIKTHYNTIYPDYFRMLHITFYKKWQEWKTKNKETLNVFLKLRTTIVYNEVF